MPFDIGIGLMLGVLLHANSDLTYFLCIVIGLISTLSPDLDFVWRFVKDKRAPNTTHRDTLHYPLIFVPAMGIIGLLFSPYIGATLAIGSLIHFIHDSIGIGFGIKWLYPLRKNSYLFLFQIKTPVNTTMPKKRFYSWTDKERAQMIAKYEYKDWIRFVYFQPNPFGLIEYSVLVIGLLVAVG